MERSIFDLWWRSHQSLAREGLRFFQILCYALERWARIHNQILSGLTSWRGSKFITIQSFGHNWWWANGILVESEITSCWQLRWLDNSRPQSPKRQLRVSKQSSLRSRGAGLMVSQWNFSEYFPGFTTLQLCYKVQELPAKLSVTPEYFSLTDHLHVGCSTTSHGDLKTMNRNANQAPNSFRFMPKRFSPGRWSFLRLASEKKWHSTHECKPRADDDQIQWKRTPSLPSHESTVPRNGQKQRMWKIINKLLCRWRYDWNCFSHN